MKIKYVIIIILIILLLIALYFLFKNYNKQKFVNILNNNRLYSTIRNSNKKKNLKGSAVDPAISKQRLESSILGKGVFISDNNTEDIKKLSPVTTSFFKDDITIWNEDGTKVDCKTLSFDNKYIFTIDLNSTTMVDSFNTSAVSIVNAINSSTEKLPIKILNSKTTFDNLFNLNGTQISDILNNNDNYISYNVSIALLSNVIGFSTELFDESYISADFYTELLDIIYTKKIVDIQDVEGQTNYSSIERDLQTKQINNMHINDASFAPYRDFLKKWGSHIITNIYYGKSLNAWESIVITDTNKENSLHLLQVKKDNLIDSINGIPNQHTQLELNTALGLPTVQSIYIDGGTPDQQNSLMKKQDQVVTGYQESPNGYNNLEVDHINYSIFMKSDSNDSKILYEYTPVWSILKYMYSMECGPYTDSDYFYLVKSLTPTCSGIIIDETYRNTLLQKYSSKLIPNLNTEIRFATTDANLAKLAGVKISYPENQTLPFEPQQNISMNIGSILSNMNIATIKVSGDVNYLYGNCFDITNVINLMIINSKTYFSSFFTANEYEYVLYLGPYVNTSCALKVFAIDDTKIIPDIKFKNTNSTFTVNSDNSMAVTMEFDLSFPITGFANLYNGIYTEKFHCSFTISREFYIKFSVPTISDKIDKISSKQFLIKDTNEILNFTQASSNTAQVGTIANGGIIESIKINGIILEEPLTASNISLKIGNETNFPPIVLENNPQELISGQIIQLLNQNTTDSFCVANNYLTISSTGTILTSPINGEYTQWIIRKYDETDPHIHDGDAVVLKSVLHLDDMYLVGCNSHPNVILSDQCVNNDSFCNKWIIKKAVSVPGDIIKNNDICTFKSENDNCSGDSFLTGCNDSTGLVKTSSDCVNSDKCNEETGICETKNCSNWSVTFQSNNWNFYYKYTPDHDIRINTGDAVTFGIDNTNYNIHYTSVVIEMKVPNLLEISNIKLPMPDWFTLTSENHAEHIYYMDSGVANLSGINVNINADEFIKYFSKVYSSKPLTFAFADTSVDLFGYIEDNTIINKFCKSKSESKRSFISKTRVKVLDTFTEGTKTLYDMMYVDQQNPKNIRNVIEIFIDQSDTYQTKEPCQLLQAAYNLETAYVTMNDGFCAFTNTEKYGIIQKMISKKIYDSNLNDVRSYGCWNKATGCQSDADCSGNTIDSHLDRCTYGRGAGRIPDKRPCGPGERDDGTSCWVDEYGRGAGRIPDKRPCAPGERDDGTSCWVDSYDVGAGTIPSIICPSGWYARGIGADGWCELPPMDNGKGCCCTVWGCCGCSGEDVHDTGCTCSRILKTQSAQIKCPDDRPELDKGLCYPHCRDGYHRSVTMCIPNGHDSGYITTNAFDRSSCHDDEEFWADSKAFCYPKCKDGFHPEGCCTCAPNGHIGGYITANAFDRSSCHDNEEFWGASKAFCYPKCNDGYHNEGCCICAVDKGKSCGSDSYDVQLCSQDNGLFGATGIIYGDNIPSTVVTRPSDVPSSVNVPNSNENIQYSCAGDNARLDHYGNLIRNSSTYQEPCKCQNPNTIPGKEDQPYSATFNIYNDRLVWDQMKNSGFRGTQGSTGPNNPPNPVPTTHRPTTHPPTTQRAANPSTS